MSIFQCEKWSIKFNCNKVLRVRMCGFKCEKTERLIQLQQSAAGAGKNVRVEMCILKTPRNLKKYEKFKILLESCQVTSKLSADSFMSR